jgi:hypothetical protein
MAKYALLQIFEPVRVNGSLIHEESIAIQNISSKAKRLCKDDANIQAIGEFSWVFPLQHCQYSLSLLITLAHNAGFRYRIAYLDDIQWLEFSDD